MDKSFIAGVIMGLLLDATGGFMLGRHSEPAGIFFILCGIALIFGQWKPSKPKPHTDWLGNKHLE